MNRIRQIALGASPAFLLILLFSLFGCGRKDDLNKARVVVDTSLNCWMQGEDPQLLAGQGIEIADPDWQSGHRLLDFTVKDASSLPQQGPRVVVVLSMQDKRGKKMDAEVAYEVLLTDKVKIGRDAFHVAP